LDAPPGGPRGVCPINRRIFGRARVVSAFERARGVCSLVGVQPSGCAACRRHGRSRTKLGFARIGQAGDSKTLVVRNSPFSHLACVCRVHGGCLVRRAARLSMSSHSTSSRAALHTTAEVKPTARIRLRRESRYLYSSTLTRRGTLVKSNVNTLARLSAPRTHRPAARAALHKVLTACKLNPARLPSQSDALRPRRDTIEGIVPRPTDQPALRDMLSTLRRRYASRARRENSPAEHVDAAPGRASNSPVRCRRPQ
jgi:hypothetical protein